jgi:hypothetical protein
MFKFLKTYKTLFPTSEIIPLPNLIDVFDRVAKCKTIKKCPSRIWKIKLIIHKSMWQICTTSRSIEEVLGESSDLITFNFNEGTNHELFLQVRCLVTNATSYNVFIGQEALFPPGFTTSSSVRTTKWIGRLMATIWDTYPLIYMGTIVLWFTIVCSRKHTQFPTYNKLATSE